MIQKNGKQVVFTNDAVKQKREALKVEVGRHKGKPISNLTKKELEDALSAALKLLGMLDENDKIR